MQQCCCKRVQVLVDISKNRFLSRCKAMAVRMRRPAAAAKRVARPPDQELPADSDAEPEDPPSDRDDAVEDAAAFDENNPDDQGALPEKNSHCSFLFFGLQVNGCTPYSAAVVVHVARNASGTSRSGLPTPLAS